MIRIRYYKNDTVRWLDPWGNSRIGKVERDTEADASQIPVIWENDNVVSIAQVRPDEVYAISGVHQNVDPHADTEILPSIPTAAQPRRWWQFWKPRSKKETK